jgi:hypothetical protein
MQKSASPAATHAATWVRVPCRRRSCTSGFSLTKRVITGGSAVRKCVFTVAIVSCPIEPLVHSSTTW